MNVREELEGGHTMESVAVAEIDGTVMNNLYAVAFAAVVIITRYWEDKK